MSQLSEEVSCTETSLSASIPCFNLKNNNTTIVIISADAIPQSLQLPFIFFIENKPDQNRLP